MKTFLYQYKAGSASAKVLAQALGIKRIKVKGSKFKPNPRKRIINWGSSSTPNDYLRCHVLNPPEAVGLAANKLYSIRAFDERNVSTVAWCKTKADAAKLIEDGETIVCRTKLTGNSGEGIVIAETVDQLVDAPLYTVYKKKQQEYRVHVFNGEVIDTQRKARKRDVPDDQVNWKVRNLDGGFIFARNEDHEVPAMVLEEGVKAVGALGLDFGAVDVIWNDKDTKAYVLEVNTAPGLMGTTLEKYVEAFNV